MQSLDKDLRGALERTVKAARTIAETAANASVDQLGVGQDKPEAFLTDAEKALRNRLRTHGKQLGDARDSNSTNPTYGKQEVGHLVQEVAYEHWHRMLFARFLADNDLLMYDGVAVTIEECDELAPGEGAKNGWELAGKLAARMLPQIFRPDSPAYQLNLPQEHQHKLERLVANLSKDIFLAADSLGWVYQFWQADNKDQINNSGVKIGAEELPAVTQLFTEDYMVDFLLDNTLGAWHAGKVLVANPKLANSAQSEDELRHAVSLHDHTWSYLRFVKGQDDKWTPAAGTFDDWPKTAKNLKCLDPCMGSGHFVVAMFERLVALRMAEEKIDEKAAVEAVIEGNLFGLELDPRCTQIGAFNLALAAWRRVGYCKLPPMNLACSGLAPNTREADWLVVAGDNERLQAGMEGLYRSFESAPVLGSLINPLQGAGDLYVADYHELQPLLDKALAQEAEDDTAHEMAVTARGLAKAAEILADQFTLVATNVPYLKAENQGPVLKEFIELNFNDAKADLATAFVRRWYSTKGQVKSLAVVLPQNWLSQPRYTKFRDAIIEAEGVTCIARLGPRAFRSITGEVVNVLLGVFAPLAAGSHAWGLDTASEKTPDAKREKLLGGSWAELHLRSSLGGARDNRVTFSMSDGKDSLASMGLTFKGITSNDDPSFLRCFWELERCSASWEFHLTAVGGAALYGGRTNLILFEKGDGRMRALSASQSQDRKRDLQGNQAWGKRGVAISLMGSFPVTPYHGEKFDTNVAVFIPHDAVCTSALFTYFADPQFSTDLRSVDGALKLTNSSIKAVSFDLERWKKVAAERYPRGLPKPFSSDPTQWLFDGHPVGADQPLQVAVARLLGYQWPRQTGSSFPDCPALAPDGLEQLADSDGIVCIPAVGQESSAADRLMNLLAAAYGSDWSNDVLSRLLADVGYVSKGLETWLREGFFTQHVNLFHKRPFIWHIWDGLRDGFAAVVNYHKLDYKTLEALIYTYLGDWINRQKRDADNGVDGAQEKLAAAEGLKKRLELILAGEAPYDIFVRWKPIEEQPIGWNPDLNDGVRLNIRPFLSVPDVGKKGAGVLRDKPKSLHWEKDRGSDVPSAPWYKLGLQYDGKVGDRINDHHLSLEEKQKARNGK
ncbi:SAM-dependent DNA methyltransferase [Pseudomonas sp. DCB_AW]|uniref:Eco57I restriction-modification methylase domain-containing protein n=1 Tax=Pseudomonas sp. DCB_AW TaxID=2993596 RepID=UPI00224911E6|nr:SAM-dependent DNA methyltransferase [Pseudomonas sp. DCB_AW]MCX2687664.1 SAM-dependent DNA methyltransferase [Pseudomonas sp. DCB_AW]